MIKSNFLLNKLKPKNAKRLMVAGLVVVVLVAVGLVVIVRPVYGVYVHAQNMKDHSVDLKTAIEQKDLGAIAVELDHLGLGLNEIETELGKLAYVGNLPWFGSYYQDALNAHTSAEIMIETLKQVVVQVEPYAHVLGLKSTSDEDALDIEVGLKELIKLSPQLMPSADTLLDGVDRALPYLSKLHESNYINFAELPIRDWMSELRTVVTLMEENHEDIRAFVHSLPSLMGEPDPQKYLVLFQNDKELRPTGGFITSFAVVSVDSAEVTVSDARNIYEVSSEEAYLPPPGPIAVYLKQPLWRMRDTNFSPDFKESMETFLYYWNNLRLTKVDGIIALDTQFVAALLEQLGSVEVEDYAYDFSAFPNLPGECREGGSSFTHENVVCRLEVYAQQLGLNQFQRKAVIGDLMERMFEKVMALPQDKWYVFLEKLIKQLNEKHALLYLENDVAQGLGEEYNWTGRIVASDGDYLHVNDSNLAGLKSDMYLKRSVDQRYEIDADGAVTKHVKLTYENTGSFDGWLNAVARNYVRIYVPQGSELIEVVGGEVKTTVMLDLEKTVFDNFLLIPPLEKAEIEFVYKLPFKYYEGMDLLIQKQPGLGLVYHSLEFEGEKIGFELVSDKNIKLDN